MRKVILITGCSSGFGRVTAEYLLKKGYLVIATARKKADLANFTNGLELDVTWEQEKINRIVDKIITTYGRIDVLINNAGYGLLGKVEDLSSDSVRNQMETNYLGALKMIKSVLPQMKRQHQGLIINISSILGLFSIPQYSAYAASKHALEALSQSLRLEVQKDNLKVVVINPGAFKTNFYAKSENPSNEKYRPDGYGLDPLLVAKLTEKIITSPNPKANYLVGSEAITVRLLLKLPRIMKEYLLKQYFT